MIMGRIRFLYFLRVIIYFLRSSFFFKYMWERGQKCWGLGGSEVVPRTVPNSRPFKGSPQSSVRFLPKAIPSLSTKP